MTCDVGLLLPKGFRLLRHRLGKGLVGLFHTLNGLFGPAGRLFGGIGGILQETSPHLFRRLPCLLGKLPCFLSRFGLGSLLFGCRQGQSGGLVGQLLLAHGEFRRACRFVLRRL